MRIIDDFEDSSDDEEIVEKNPYRKLSRAKKKDMKVPLTLTRLTKINENKAILKRDGKSHQYLLKHPAIEGKKKPDAKNKSPSHFPAPLMDVKKMMDAVPSNAKTQTGITTSIVPSFRGLKWRSDMSASDVFFSTRVHWEGECSYSSLAFIMSKINVRQHTMAFFLSDANLLAKYDDYDLTILDAEVQNGLEYNNGKLESASKQLKDFFALTDKIRKPFTEWKSIFVKLRDSKDLNGTNNKGQAKVLSLSEILSYVYVNGYEEFKTVFKNLDATLKKLKNNDPGVAQLKKFFNDLKLSPNERVAGMPYLSEGQIPRHALLYAFGLKAYTQGRTQDAEALYKVDLKPKKGKVYLGKVLVTNNPNTLFSGKDKAVSIPDFDEKYGGAVIAKAIVGEKEIQHQGANLQGTTEKSINIKLPKFHHTKCPQRYRAKYGLNDELYNNFKSTFNFLSKMNEYDKLSWMYLETVVLAHLIQFHEVQLTKYCNQMATDNNKQISWFNRAGKAIDDPFPIVANAAP